MPFVGLGLLIPVALVIFWFLSGIRIVNEYEQGVVLRLGRFSGIRNAGLKWSIPFIDRHTEPWGVKVTAVEVKQVDLPEEMRRAMARQAEAERERRSKVIAADAEFQAAEKLGQAADVIARSPGALQLRYLQTLVEISAEKSSTVVFPLPLELVKVFLDRK